MSDLRPKMWEKDPRIGWKTVDVKRNDVPLQNASMAEPPNAFAMIFAMSVDVGAVCVGESYRKSN